MWWQSAWHGMSGLRMPNPIEDILKADIQENGPMSLARFLEIVLSHPQYGYYMNRDPFGGGGDFVTAPEVSQLFGEIIGAWAADVWMKMGQPERLILCECGPGRGTLMADAMRATKGLPDFHEAVELHLLEISPILQERQRAALGEFNPQWHKGLENLPDDAPMIVMGNEFLDALPFISLQKTREGWAERVVNYDGAYTFDLRLAAEFEDLVPFHLKKAEAGSIFEAAPVRNEFMTRVSERLKRQGGAAVFIDYGHVKTSLGDTFQALKDNKYVEALSCIGDADLTSHVDFEALVAEVFDQVQVHGPVTQGEFLRALGVEVRAQMLIDSNSEQQCADVKNGLHRLVASSEMGALFKVIGLSYWHGKELEIAGF